MVTVIFRMAPLRRAALTAAIATRATGNSRLRISGNSSLRIPGNSQESTVPGIPGGNSHPRKF